MFDKLIQHIQINIGKKLGSQISDGEPFALVHFEKRFMWRDVFQHSPVSPEKIIFRTVMEDDLMDKTADFFRWIRSSENIEQNLFVDTHEKRSNIELNEIGRLFPVA